MSCNLSATAPRRAQRGSAFVTVMIFTSVLLILTASIISWSVTERRLNLRSAYWLEARNAAEAVAEYGFAQVVTRYNSYATPPSLDPSGSSPLSPPPTSFFTGGKTVTSNWTSSNPTGLEIIGGTAGVVPTTGALYYVDPNNPDNQFDTLKGEYVFRRDLQVLSRATVTPPAGSGSPITAYVTEKVSIRGAPLFAHAVFYSDNDLEVSPGPVLDIYGPVHVNGNMFPSAQGTVEVGTANSVNFHGPVSMTGDLYHAWGNEKTAAEGRGYNSSSGTLDGEPLGGDPVTFVNGAGAQTNIKNAAGTWKDSTMGNLGNVTDSQGRYNDKTTPAINQLQAKLDPTFRQYAAQTWNGNVQTAAMGVGAYHPISFTQPIDAAGTLPDPHVIIDPPDTTLTTSDTFYSAKHEVEAQKFANQVGLYVQVAVTAGVTGAADSASVILYGPAGSAPSGTAASDIGPNGGIRLGTYASATPNGMVKFIPYQAASVSGTTTTAATQTVVSYAGTGPVGGKYAYVTTTTVTTGTVNASGSITTNGSGGSSNVAGGTFSATGTPSTTTATSLYSYSSSSNAKAAAPGGGSTVTTVVLTGSPSTSVTGTSSANVTSGIYDQRQLSGTDLVQVDMAALRAALLAANANTNAGGNTAITNLSNNDWGVNAANGGLWNGGIYIEVKSATGSGYPGKTSVALADAAVASGSSLVPTVNSVTGLMIATNAPVYVLGNFNADGANATVAGSYNAAQYPDDHRTNASGTPTSAEIPIAIAADAISILSPNYFGAAGANGSSVPASNGTTTNAYGSLQTAGPSASGDAEIAAAFITGIVATTSSTFSGGLHNLPRFLEVWGSSTVAIRGSLVSLFKSKVATAPWAQRYYGAPKRNWGFDKIFENGTFPPLTPKVMSYRRIDYTNMSAAAYGAARHALWPSVYTSTAP